MRCSIDSLLIAVRRAVAAAGCVAFVTTGNATFAEPEAGAVTARGLEQTADDAIAKLVDFLQHPEGGPEGAAEGGAEGGARSPHHAPQPNQGVQAGPPAGWGWGGPLVPGQGGAIVLPPKVSVFSFGVEVGADGKVKQGSGGPAGFTLDSIEGLEGIIARHVQSMQGPSQPQPQPLQPVQQPQPPQGPHHPGQPHHPQPNQYGQPQFQAPLPPHVPTPFPPPAMAPVPFDAHAHVTQQLDQILGKLDRLEARLGGPSPQGQPPFAPLPHGGPRQSGPQRGGPGPQFHGRMVPPGQHQPGSGPGGPNPDELNRRFEEHARDLHRHVEEMARGLGEKLKGAAGGGEELRQMLEKLAKTHEQLQDRFQDIRRRFAEQQERIERLEQEVRRLHEAHGVGRAEGEKRDRKHEEKGAKQRDGEKGNEGDRKRDETGAKRRDAEKQGAAPGATQTPNVSYEGEESASL